MNYDTYLWIVEISFSLQQLLLIAFSYKGCDFKYCCVLNVRTFSGVIVNRMVIIYKYV